MIIMIVMRSIKPLLNGNVIISWHTPLLLPYLWRTTKVGVGIKSVVEEMTLPKSRRTESWWNNHCVWCREKYI